MAQHFATPKKHLETTQPNAEQNSNPNSNPNLNPGLDPDPPLCAACAAKSNTCCFVEPGSEIYCFPISKAEQKRIVRLGPGFEKNFTVENNAPEFMQAMHSLFPGEKTALENIFPPNGQHLRLSTLPAGHCAFLTENGCALPRETRPWFCKLFPLWVYRQELTAFTPKYCLLTKGARNPLAVLQKLELTQEEARHTYNQLRLDWGLVPERAKLP